MSNPSTTGDQILDSVVRAGEMMPSQDEQAAMLGQVYYLLKDDEVSAILRGSPDLVCLIPFFSHLSRTSNLDKKTVEMLKLRLKMALRLVLLCQREPNLVNVALYNALLAYGYAALEDGIQGWRGRLCTEKIKTYKVETQAQKRNKVLGLF